MVSKAIHFDGCGAAFPYTVGFCVYLDQRFKEDRTIHYAGVSSGAWIAAAKVLGVPLEECVNLASELQDQVRRRKMGLIGEFKRLLRDYYENLCPKNYNYKGMDRAHIRITESKLKTYFVTPTIRQKIFEPFYTTKDIGKGTGVGLSSAKGIVESHGGSLKIEDPGEGTTFVITLPIAEQTDKAS